MPDLSRAPFQGFAAPRTERGVSSPYGPVPWRMRGRTIALWYRLQVPDEARRHVPPECKLSADPVVRARFWDMQHDAGLPAADGDLPSRFREAVVAFPVECAGVAGDFTTHMFTDDPTYIAFGRETMGWPLRFGAIEISEPSVPRVGGSAIEGRLVVDGRAVMEATVRLIVERPRAVGPDVLPRWIGWKVIPHVDGRTVAVDQLVETGPQEFDRATVWEADGELSFGDVATEELGYLRPREIVAAEYWDGVYAVIGPGRVLRAGGMP